MIDLSILDFLANKMREIRKNEAMPWNTKFALYDLLIEIQGYVSDQLDKPQEGYDGYNNHYIG